MHQIEDKINYHFKDKKTLEMALTHPSLNSRRDGVKGSVNFERLEFLGDSVLGLLIAEYLISEYPNETEGELARRHSALVCGETLVKVASEIDIGSSIIMSAGEEATGGRINKGNLEDVCEALIAAIYLDGGLEQARNFVMRFWHPLASKISAPPKDAKTALQEWAQARGLPLPSYKVISSSGPAHSPVFEVEVSVIGVKPKIATAGNKKAAEHLAAKMLLDDL